MIALNDTLAADQWGTVLSRTQAQVAHLVMHQINWGIYHPLNLVLRLTIGHQQLVRPSR